MAMSNTDVVHSMLWYALLASFIVSINSSVIKRREVAPTLKQQNDPIDILIGENQSTTTTIPTPITTLKIDELNTSQDGNMPKSTKLMPQRINTYEEPFSVPSTKTTLNLVNDPSPIDTEMKISTEGTRNETLQKDLSSTISSIKNTIDMDQDPEERDKMVTNMEEIRDIKTKDSMPPTTEGIVPVNNTQSQSQMDTTPSTTESPLLLHKAQLSLEDSNEIQISSSSKQPKFLNDNSTNSNQLNLPNTVDVWTLAGMKSVTPRLNHSNIDVIETNSDHSKNPNNITNSLLNPVKEKTLTDWTHIVQMGVDKSVGNALTEDEQHHFDDEEITPLIMTTTLHAIPSPTTVTNPKLDESDSESNTIKSTTSMFSFEKSMLSHEMTTTSTPLTSVTSVNTERNELLSVNDNVDSLNANNNTENTNNNKQHLTGEPALFENNEEKFKGTEENDELQSSPMNTSQRESEILTTLETTTTMKMTTISTPATALVKTTESTLEEDSTHINGIKFESPSESEKKGNRDSADTAVIDGSETKGNSSEFPIAFTTISSPIEEPKTTTTTTTTTTVRPTILATNVEEVINFSTTTRQPPPDIHQIGTKSNLETPTTTIKTTKATIETTPTTTTSGEREEENSSAIANQTLTETKTNDNDSRSSSSSSNSSRSNGSSQNDVINTTTTDSLSGKSTSSEEPKFLTLPTSTTTTKTKTTKEIIITTTPNTVGEETTVAKDTTLPSTTLTAPTASTASPPLLIIDEKQVDQYDIYSNKNTSTTKTTNNYTDVYELPSVTTESTLYKPIATKTTTEVVDITTTTITVPSNRNITEMSNATVPTARERQSTEAPLTNFIDDSTTSTTSTTIAPPNSTISPATIAKTTTTTTITNISTATHTSSPPLSAETTESVDVNSVITEETTLNVESTTPIIVTTTPTTTLTELPAFIPHETTTTITTTEEKTTTEMVPVTTHSNHFESIPSMPASTTLSPITFPDGIGILRANPPVSPPDNPETDVNVVIAISVSVIGVVALILLVAFLYLMRKRQKQTSYGQRCRPVGMDAYSLDNVSVLGSMRRKGALRASKRSYGNAAFDDPSLRHNVLQTADLAKFVERRSSIFEEFRDVPQITARPEEIPEGCENKNRYANVIPLPETRVVLRRTDDNDDTTEYINANYVRGPKDAPNYYIACQAPLESTVQDFWRMIWEQQSRVIIQATDLIENGVEKCAEYLPPSVTLDNHTTFGDFQVTLKNREVKDKYAISTVMLKHTPSNTSREITHYWYKWPEIGVPSEESPIIAMLLEARSSLKSYALEVTNELKEKSNSENESGDSKAQLATTGSSGREINGNFSEKTKNITRNQGPLTIHCSPGTGRTGTIISCDMGIRSLETTKSLDIPQIVYYIRRGRASAVQTKEQYEFIYKVSNVYAMKITNVPNDN